MEEKTYRSTIVESLNPLTIKEKINYKDLTACKRVDLVLKEAGDDTITLYGLQQFIIMDVHNESCKNPDYTVYLFEFEGGERYITSSPSAYRSFSDIRDELEEANESILGVDLSFSRRASKTQQNGFIICNLA